MAKLSSLINIPGWKSKQCYVASRQTSSRSLSDAIAFTSFSQRPLISCFAEESRLASGVFAWNRGGWDVMGWCCKDVNLNSMHDKPNGMSQIYYPLSGMSCLVWNNWISAFVDKWTFVTSHFCVTYAMSVHVPPGILCIVLWHYSWSFLLWQENCRMGGSLVWPPTSKILDYRQKVKNRILEAIDHHPLSTPVTQNSIWVSGGHSLSLQCA